MSLGFEQPLPEGSIRNEQVDATASSKQDRDDILDEIANALSDDGPHLSDGEITERGNVSHKAANDILLPMIRKILPGMIANEILEVRPVQESTAEIFLIKSPWGNPFATSSIKSKPNEFKPLNISSKLKGWTTVGGFGHHRSLEQVGQPIPHWARRVEVDGDSEVPPLAAG